VRAGRPQFDSWQCNVFLFSTSSRPVVAHPASRPMIPGAFSLRVKWPGGEADLSPPSSAEVKNGGAVPYLY
jgi:hypothetical protein